MDEHGHTASSANQNSHPLPREGGRGVGSYLAQATPNDGIAIVGGGPVGMALALALSRHGISSRIFDARTRRSVLDDKRILALSHGSRQILEWLGVWDSITATPIAAIHVSQQGGFGRTRLTAREQGVPALGYVAAAAEVAAALDDALSKTAIGYSENSRITHADATADQVSLHSTAGNIAARLVAYAEGAIEANAADGAAVVRDYGQDAVICTVSTREPSARTAYERFTAQGPLALLPYGEELAVVYTCPAEAAAGLAGLPDAGFLERLQAHFGNRLTFLAATPRHVFPLALRYRKSPVGARSVWLGNAAQTLHPVAGQGFNLAIRDVWELSRILAASTTTDPGEVRTLARYAAARRLDRYSIIGFTDALARYFRNDTPLLGAARGLGLLALDMLPPLRSLVAKRMMYGARAWP